MIKITKEYLFESEGSGSSIFFHENERIDAHFAEEKLTCTVEKLSNLYNLLVCLSKGNERFSLIVDKSKFFKATFCFNNEGFLLETPFSKLVVPSGSFKIFDSSIISVFLEKNENCRCQ